jgi:hypothetical protein
MPQLAQRFGLDLADALAGLTNKHPISLNAFPLAFKKVEALRQWCLGHPSSL